MKYDTKNQMKKHHDAHIFFVLISYIFRIFVRFFFVYMKWFRIENVLFFVCFSCMFLIDVNNFVFISSFQGFIVVYSASTKPLRLGVSLFRGLELRNETRMKIIRIQVASFEDTLAQQLRQSTHGLQLRPDVSLISDLDTWCRTSSIR